MVKNATKLIKWLHVQNPDAILFAGFESALINVGYISHRAPIAVYSKTKLLDELQKRNFSKDDASEYYANYFGSICAGEHTPVIIEDTIKE